LYKDIAEVGFAEAPFKERRLAHAWSYARDNAGILIITQV